jgi:hypothetical protein
LKPKNRAATLCNQVQNCSWSDGAVLTHEHVCGVAGLGQSGPSGWAPSITIMPHIRSGRRRGIMRMTSCSWAAALRTLTGTLSWRSCMRDGPCWEPWGPSYQVLFHHLLVHVPMSSEELQRLHNFRCRGFA